MPFKIKEIKEYINTLPEEFDDYLIVVTDFIKKDEDGDLHGITHSIEKIIIDEDKEYLIMMNDSSREEYDK
jgi:hypothetical protein